MNQPMQNVNGKDLSLFAADKLTIWSELVNAEVTHSERGVGRITSVDQRPGYIPLIRITFENETTTFNSDSFRDGMTSVLIGTSLASQVVAWMAVQTEIEKKLVERASREIAKNKEFEHSKAKTLEAFRPLTNKYNVPPADLWEDNTLSPLGSILEKLENNEQPDILDIEWLEGRDLRRLLATIHYREYKRTGDVWSLVKACKYLRRVDLPEMVITASDGISSANIQDKRALSALWTTRGGAYRDLNDLAAAKQSATNAIRESPTSFHPQNLMGAILYEEGFPTEGDVHFAEAVRLGSTPRNQDSEIRRALDRSFPEARQRVVKYLLSKDPEKYAWVRKLAVQV